MSECRSPSEEHRDKRHWRSYYANTVTLCSLYCDGCTVCSVSYLVAVVGTLVFFATGGYIVGATATAVYAGLDVKQRIDRQTEHLQLLQAALAAVVAVAAAQDGRLVILVYLGFIAAIGHLSQAAMAMESHRYGDCERCYRTAENCTCQRLKEPVPPGSLDEAACIVTRAMRRRRLPRRRLSL